MYDSMLKDYLEQYHLLLDVDDQPVGYYNVWGHLPHGPRTLREIASQPGIPLMNIIPSVLHQ